VAYTIIPIEWNWKRNIWYTFFNLNPIFVFQFWIIVQFPMTKKMWNSICPIPKCKHLKNQPHSFRWFLTIQWVYLQWWCGKLALDTKSMNFTMIKNINDKQKCQIVLSCKGETNYCTWLCHFENIQVFPKLKK
jgi:hypothetical protein